MQTAGVGCNDLWHVTMQVHLCTFRNICVEQFGA